MIGSDKELFESVNDTIIDSKRNIPPTVMFDISILY